MTRLLVAWAAVADAEPLARETARALTGRHPGPLFRRCPHCGSTAHGAPAFGAGPFVSIAHAPGISLVAVTSAGAVGVDLEPDGTCPSWVRREAAGKARGRGVLEDPSTEGMWVEDLHVPGYVAAVAVLANERPRITAGPAAPAPAARP